MWEFNCEACGTINFTKVKAARAREGHQSLGGILRVSKAYWVELTVQGFHWLKAKLQLALQLGSDLKWLSACLVGCVSNLFTPSFDVYGFKFAFLFFFFVLGDQGPLRLPCHASQHKLVGQVNMQFLLKEQESQVVNKMTRNFGLDGLSMNIM